MAKRVCPTPGCPNLTDAGRCDEHTKRADQARGTATQRGYNSAGHKAFREDVLARDPICVICGRVPATVADHWPTSRRDLVAQGMDPNDAARGRGLCARCHSTETAQHQPGGWANRT